MIVAGYIRVSTREQGDSGLGLEAQRRQLVTETARRDGWRLGTIAAEVKSGADLRRRPELSRLLDQLDAGEFGALMFTRMDRATRSLGDFAALMDRARRGGWAVVMLDPMVDMTDAWGEALAGMAAIFAQLERALISQRTIAGLQVARDRGTFRPGEHSREARDEVIARMLELRTAVAEHREDQPMGFAAIAKTLNLEGTPAPGGGQWHPRTVSRIINRMEAAS